MHVVQHVSKSLDLHWLTLGMAIMDCYVVEIWKFLQPLLCGVFWNGNRTIVGWWFAVCIAVWPASLHRVILCEAMVYTVLFLNILNQAHRTYSSQTICCLGISCCVVCGDI